MTKSGSGSRNLNYEVTLKEAQRRFCEQELDRMAALSGTKVNEQGRILLSFLGQEYEITPAGEVTGSEEISLTVKILLLHYLVHAQGVPIQHKLISFKELPGGLIYIEPFTNRAIRPLVSVFGDNPASLLTTGQKLGGEKAELGDVSLKINVLPSIPITLVLWAGDEEFPPSGNILFDASASYFLPTEDYAVLSSLLISQLKGIKAAK